MNDSFAITLWNVMWASRTSRRGSFFVRRLADLRSQVICLTEAHADILPEEGHVVTSEPDYGYPIRPGRRKVLLWSRSPWRDVDSLGSSGLPSGRFVAATTDTPCGPVRFIGVCIPWRDAHVRSGRRSRQAWEDHLTYLERLGPILHKDAGIPTVLLGDFNQRIPRKRQPQRVFDALAAALSPDFQIATTGLIKGAPSPAIDHLALRGPLEPFQIECLDRRDSTGAAMSDHFGLRIVLQGRKAV